MFSRSAVLFLVIAGLFQARCNLLEDGTGPKLTEEETKGLLNNPNLVNYLQQMLNYMSSPQGATQTNAQTAQTSGINSAASVESQQSLSQSSSSSSSSKQSSSSVVQNSASTQNVANQVAEVILGNKGSAVNHGSAMTSGLSEVASSQSSTSAISSSAISSESSSMASSSQNAVSQVAGVNHGSALTSGLGVTSQMGSVSNSEMASSQSSTSAMSSESSSSQNAASQVAAILTNGHTAGVEKVNQGAVVSQGSLLSDFGATSAGSVSSNSMSSNSMSSNSMSSSNTASSSSMSSNSAATQGASMINLNEISNVGSNSMGSNVISSSSMMNEGAVSSSSSQTAHSSMLHEASSASQISTASQSSMLNQNTQHVASAEGQYHVSAEEAARQAKNAKYHFSMFVDDNIQGLLQEREEIRENGIVRGAFAYDDGHIRRVVYYHDNGHGMVITRDDISPSQKAKGSLDGRVTVRTTTNGQTVAYSYTANDVPQLKKAQGFAVPI